MAGAISLAIAYGMDIQPSDDPYIELAEKAHEGLMQAALPGSFLVDTLPFCELTFPTSCSSVSASPFSQPVAVHSFTSALLQ